MIGFQWLAVQVEDEKFICGTTGALSIELSVNDAWCDKYQVSHIVSQFKRLPKADKGEFEFDLKTLNDINSATNCIEGRNGYHKHASDGIVVIPLSRDKFVRFKDFVKEDIIEY